MKLAALFSAALLLSTPGAFARRTRRSRSDGTPPSDGTDLNTDVTQTSGSVSSGSSCHVSADTHTTSTAQNAYANLVKRSWNWFCTGRRVDDLVDSGELQREAEAVADLMITLKVSCSSSGNAWACGSSWADAESFAAACFDISALALAEIDTNDCDCNVAVFGDASAYARIFGHVLSSIYAQADLSGCTDGTGQTNPTAFSQQVVKECAATSIATITFRALADAYLENSCNPYRPAICDNCCASEAGFEGCNCDDCYRTQNQYAEAFAQAYVSSTQEGGAECTQTTTNLLTNIAETIDIQVPLEDFTVGGTTSGPSSAECLATMESDATADAISAHASRTANAWLHACQGWVIDPSWFRPRTDTDSASAIATVYQQAFADCWIEGPNVRGCALSESFGTAFAAACANATAAALAELRQEDCPCGGDMHLLIEQFASDQVRLFAAVEQTVGAQVCGNSANPEPFSEITRECVADAYALATATAFAHVWNRRGECRPPPPRCVSKCADAGDVDNCVAACSARAWDRADAVATTHVQIDWDTEAWCSGEAIGNYWFSNFNDTGVESDELSTGDVQATLRWTGDADLDLYVRTPAGNIIYYDNLSADGGTLDGDLIPNCGNELLNVENTAFPVGSAADGTYQAWVRLFRANDCGDDDSGVPIEYNLVLKVAGDTVAERAGRFTSGDRFQESEKISASFPSNCAGGGPGCT